MSGFDLGITLGIAAADKENVFRLGYRRARLKNYLFTIDRELTKHIERRLARITDSSIDNHTTYVIFTGNNQIAIHFSDAKTYIGTEIEIADTYY